MRTPGRVAIVSAGALVIAVFVVTTISEGVRRSHAVGTNLIALARTIHEPTSFDVHES